jgi:hypothetical protein
MLRRLGSIAGQSTDVPPSAPTITSIAPGNGFLTVNFTPPSSDGGRAITNYQFSVNNGASWTTRSPASVSSPIVISGLTNGVNYNVVIRAVNLEGVGDTSNMVIAKPYTTPTAPQSVTVTNGGGGVSAPTVSISFSAPFSNGGDNITNYQYSLNGGSTWITRSPASITSPLQITGLSNSSVYSVGIRAVNSAGGGTSSGFTSIRPLPSLQSISNPTTPAVSSYPAQSSANNTYRTVNWTVDVANDFSPGTWLVRLIRSSNNTEITRTTTYTTINSTSSSFTLNYSTNSADFNTNVYIVVVLTDSAGQTSSWTSSSVFLPALESTPVTTWNTGSSSQTVSATSLFYPLSSGTFGLQRPSVSTYAGDTASTAPAWDRNSSNNPITSTTFRVSGISPAQSNSLHTEVWTNFSVYEWQLAGRVYLGSWTNTSGGDYVVSSSASANGIVSNSTSLTINNFRSYSGEKNRTWIFFYDINAGAWKGTAGNFTTSTNLASHSGQPYAQRLEETDFTINSWRDWDPSGVSLTKSSNAFGYFYFCNVSIVQRSNSSGATQVNGAEPGFTMSYQYRYSSSSTTYK